MKIALIGSAPSSVGLAPWQDKSFAAFAEGKQPAYPPAPHLQEEWELWGCSPGAYGAVPRFTRWFELHRWEPGKPWFSPEYCQFMREFKGPVYTGGPVPELPSHMVYPIDDVETEFSSYFLSSSLSLMAALAILVIDEARKQPGHNPDEDVIGFFGVDMSATEEYGYQRAGCQHFILTALERGIGVYVPPESDLLRPIPVYGLSEWDHNYIKLTARARELNARIAAATERATAAQGEIAHLRGAMDDLNYMTTTWTSQYGLPSGQVIRKRPELLRQHANVAELRKAGADGHSA